jgi:hypothetical protein
MWALKWGQMIWGQASAAPALGFWGAMLLGAVLGALGVRSLRGSRPRTVGIVALALAILLPVSARALPFTFTNGTVADANQVNANFAALASQQALAPTASVNVVTLVQNASNSICPGTSAGFAMDQTVGPDAIRYPFSIPAGESLVLENFNVAINLGTAAANHGLTFQVARTTSGAFNDVGVGVITLNAQGAGSATVSFGSGTVSGAGTTLCVVAQDLVTHGFVTPVFASAHGFLTSQ